MNSVQLGSASKLASKCGDGRKFATIIAAQLAPRESILLENLKILSTFHSLGS